MDFDNLSDSIENICWDDAPGIGRSTDHLYEQLPPGSGEGHQISPQGHLTLLVQGTPGGAQRVATVEIGVARRAADCHLQLQALITRPQSTRRHLERAQDPAAD